MHRLIFAAMVGVVLICLAYLPFSQYARGQQASVPPVSGGRFRMAGEAAKENNSTVFIFDSHTGRCWYSLTPDCRRLEA